MTEVGANGSDTGFVTATGSASALKSIKLAELTRLS
jgi:hypothetical protein